MSGAGDEAMDSSAVSEEEVDDPQTDESVPGRSRSKISDVGEIIEGKRAKKAVERLDFQAPKAKEKLKIADGGGDKLGDIPRTNYEINKRKAEELKLLHAILFDRPGKSASVKKNLRLFNGFPFEAGSPEFTKKRTKMLKSYNLTNAKLKLICTVLDLEKKGTQSDLIDRILNFLVAPKNSGKVIRHVLPQGAAPGSPGNASSFLHSAPVKKKRRSKKKLSGDDSKAKSKRSRPKAQSSSSGAKKSKAGSKSKAIVMDSSSDEEEEDEEKLGASVEAEGSDGEEKASEADGEEEEQSEESEESDESSKPKSSRGKKKNVAEKRQRTPAKKTTPPKKRPKNQSPDESDGDSGAEEKPKKKKVAAAKTKKADSSSSNNNSNIKTAENSSDDDEPLIRMIKKAPTDDQLKATVEKLLKEANLEEMTMKQICQKVFDTYPEHDLSSRKDFIKQTVKALIT